MISNTVNELNFAAGNFRIQGIFLTITFRILLFQEPLLTKTLLSKKACSFLNNGPILKIQIVPES